VTGISNPKCIEEIQESIGSALVEYLTSCTSSAVPEKFSQLLLKLPAIKVLGNDVKQLLILIDSETYDGSLLDGCLLGEMLYGPLNIIS
jgi:hypothetical protein